MILKSFESDLVFRENTYLLISGSQALLIDPGADPELLIGEILSGAYNLLAVLATHGHMDHILAAKPLCERFGCPFYMPGGDRNWQEELQNMCAHFRLPYYGTPILNFDLAESAELDLDPFHFKLLHTPGHSAGSVCFLTGDQLFSGDTLFRHSVGRSDLPGGDLTLMKRSLREKILSLPGATRVYPGHLEATDIAEERKHNPFVVL
jgi:glyoxylase-like metal-dependent hydrolase (beta-lactamase superfamily II)